VRRRSAARGPAVIAGELAARGVDRETVRAALAADSRDDQLEAALRLARRSPGSLDERALAGRLLRRGFTWDVVREAVRRVKEADLTLD
jgi:SOS response regulatory protein OraA/RecX